MEWVLFCGTLIFFSILMWKFWIQEIDYFGKIAEFVNFEVKDNIDDVIDVDKGEEMYKNVSDSGFTDDENKFDENVEDYYTFTNVSRRIEEAMQDSFINFDYSQEDNKYCSMIIILVRK